ncbi:MAG: zf-HC2 domain-containing protein [Pseudazoarcus pumilus]|nr:zf-HC2 domain-containing protein [Pseudazoarcus pumilus]
MLNCRQTTRLMSEEHERPLSTRERLELRMHTLLCTGCNNYRKQIAFIRRATKAVREGEAG